MPKEIAYLDFHWTKKFTDNNYSANKWITIHIKFWHLWTKSTEALMMNQNTISRSEYPTRLDDELLSAEKNSMSAV
jgi:hypothetical protein